MLCTKSRDNGGTAVPGSGSFTFDSRNRKLLGSTLPSSLMMVGPLPAAWLNSVRVTVWGEEALGCRKRPGLKGAFPWGSLPQGIGTPGHRKTDVPAHPALTPACQVLASFESQDMKVGEERARVHQPFLNQNNAFSFCTSSASSCPISAMPSVTLAGPWTASWWTSSLQVCTRASKTRCYARGLEIPNKTRTTIT